MLELKAVVVKVPLKGSSRNDFERPWNSLRTWVCGNCCWRDTGARRSVLDDEGVQGACGVEEICIEIVVSELAGMEGSRYGYS